MMRFLNHEVWQCEDNLYAVVNLLVATLFAYF